MSAPVPDAAETPPAKSANWRFRPKTPDIRLPTEEAARQSAVVKAAFAALPAAGAATAYLNAPDDALGGRPLDIAIASDAGLKRVIAALAARTSAG